MQYGNLLCSLCLLSTVHYSINWETFHSYTEDDCQQYYSETIYFYSYPCIHESGNVHDDDDDDDGDDDDTETGAPSCGVPSAMTQAEIDEILKAHNDQRRRDGADQFALVSITSVVVLGKSPCLRGFSIGPIYKSLFLSLSSGLKSLSLSLKSLSLSLSLKSLSLSLKSLSLSLKS